MDCRGSVDVLVSQMLGIVSRPVGQEQRRVDHPPARRRSLLDDVAGPVNWTERVGLGGCDLCSSGLNQPFLACRVVSRQFPSVDRNGSASPGVSRGTAASRHRRTGRHQPGDQAKPMASRLGVGSWYDDPDAISDDPAADPAGIFGGRSDCHLSALRRGRRGIRRHRFLIALRQRRSRPMPSRSAMPRSTGWFVVRNSFS